MENHYKKDKHMYKYTHLKIWGQLLIRQLSTINYSIESINIYLFFTTISPFIQKAAIRLIPLKGHAGFLFPPKHVTSTWSTKNNLWGMNGSALHPFSDAQAFCSAVKTTN